MHVRPWKCSDTFDVEVDNARRSYFARCLPWALAESLGAVSEVDGPAAAAALADFFAAFALSRLAFLAAAAADA